MYIQRYDSVVAIRKLDYRIILIKYSVFYKFLLKEEGILVSKSIWKTLLYAIFPNFRPVLPIVTIRKNTL